METVNTLTGLLAANLRELYNAEQQQKRSYAVLKNNVKNNELRNIISTQREASGDKLKRLEEAFMAIGEDVKSTDCEVMRGLMNHIETMAEKIENENVRAAGIIMGIQCVNHFKIAAYGTLAAFAQTIGLQKIATLLHQTVNEEKETDVQLTKLATQTINAKAGSITAENN